MEIDNLNDNDENYESGVDLSQNKFDSDFYYTSSPKHSTSKSKMENIENPFFYSDDAKRYNAENNHSSISSHLTYSSNCINPNSSSSNKSDIKENNQENHLFLQLYAATQLLTYFHSANLHAAINNQLYHNPSYLAQLNKNCTSMAASNSPNKSLISTEASSNTSSEQSLLLSNSPNSSTGFSSIEQTSQKNTNRKGKINFANISDLIS